MIYCDYPLAHFKVGKNKASFDTLGDSRLNCKLMIVKQEQKLPKFTIEPEYKSRKTNEGHIEFNVPGKQAIMIIW